jgi:hypothetical protein
LWLAPGWSSCLRCVACCVQSSLYQQVDAARIFIGFIQAHPGETNLTSYTHFAEATAFQRTVLSHVVYLKLVPGALRTQVGTQ